MSRKKDIQHVESQMLDLAKQKQDVLAEIAAFQIRVETELAEIQSKTEDLSTVRRFLLEREVETAPPPVYGPPEYFNGIDVSRLDHETRILVQSGNQETIAVLRRNPLLVDPKSL